MKEKIEGLLKQLAQSQLHQGLKEMNATIEHYKGSEPTPAPRVLSPRFHQMSKHEVLLEQKKVSLSRKSTI